ncbi:MAG: class I SAM-dependent methyltransferase [Treponema sp.]|nr:class I SAM-dependent methyltransferase [Treponema sp.]
MDNRISFPENQYEHKILNIVNKSTTISAVFESIEPYRDIFRKADTLLELGAGPGWLSCLIKYLFREKRILSSDIDKDAVAGMENWENTFDVKLDDKIVCDSCNIPVQNESVDIVFCFQAAHHFKKFKKTLSEIHRILKPNGHCIFLHEPSCRKFFHKIAFIRVNIKTPNRGEDVLIYKKIECIAKETGFGEVKINFRPSILNRKPVPFIYFFILNKIKILNRILPSTADFVFRK